MSRAENLSPVSKEEIGRQQEISRQIHQTLAQSALPYKKYLICTWGCQMNEHDSENLAGFFREMALEKTDSPDQADIILYNTCAVRENAELKVFGNLSALQHLKAKKPHLIIVVCGCMMQQPHVVEEIQKKYRHVNLVFGTHNLYRFPEMLQACLEDQKNRLIDVWDVKGEVVEGLPAQRAFSTRAFVNIMYGCDNFCTYCIVPYTRGRERSREVEDILQECKTLVEQGTKEITLLGQNVNSYGKTLENPVSFAHLLHQAHAISGLERIRFMTSHPKDISEELIEAMASLPKVCPSLHLPVQSGSNRVLKRMNRRYTREHYLALIEKIRQTIPGISLTTDIMVGFPGESEEDFQDTLDLVSQVQFDSAFMYLYSVRKGTKAQEMPDHIEAEVKKERFERLLSACNAITRSLNANYLGKTLEVLVEGPDKKNVGIVTGRSRENKLVHFPGAADLTGQTVRVRITQPRSFSLNGESV